MKLEPQSFCFQTQDFQQLLEQKKKVNVESIEERQEIQGKLQQSHSKLKEKEIQRVDSQRKSKIVKKKILREVKVKESQN